MIDSITLKDVASYSADTPAVFHTEGKKINLFYGLNGSGKSTLSKFLQSKDNGKYTHCSMSPQQQQEDILVYNQEFIRQNFYEIPDFQGVFTLSETNHAVELAIELATAELARIDQEKEGVQKKIVEKIKDKTNEENSLKDSIWKSKTKYERTELAFCLDGYKRKDTFLQKVKSSKGSTTATINSLITEAKELAGQDGVLKPSLPQIIFDVSEIENSPLLSEVIIGSKDSYLSDLIQKMNNSDWVKSGLSYLSKDEPCPFCQQELNTSIVNAIEQLFDDTYQAKLDAIKALYHDYEAAINIIEKTFDTPNYTFAPDSNSYSFDSKKELLINTLKFNLKQLEDKHSNPSKVANLTNTSYLSEEVNLSLSKIQSDIEIFNKKITNKQSHLNRITNNFWLILNAHHQDLIEAAEEKINDINSEIVILTNQSEENKRKETEQKTIILNNRQKITNIDLSISKINQQLSELGILGFQIEKTSDDEQRYRIIRTNGEGENVYNSLSEGEKTLISFLYFLECSTGAVNEESAVVLNRRIIVIDDPISSLSHNYIYDIASLIHHKILQAEFNQVFVLTHNLFFFHELLMLKSPRGCPPGYKLYRVTKSKFSQIKDLKRDELQNDYQMYWQVIIDCQSNPDYAHMLPNAMRNILEHYFNFIHKKDALKKALETLGESESEFKPLFRYINRGSHSDSINLIDFEGIDIDKYISKFQQVFEETGFEDHFYKMMGIEKPTPIDTETTSRMLEGEMI
ncbi:TPA: AAA family ATPase [Photobacterium damselae]